MRHVECGGVAAETRHLVDHEWSRQALHITSIQDTASSGGRVAECGDTYNFYLMEN